MANNKVFLKAYLANKSETILLENKNPVELLEMLAPDTGAPVNSVLLRIITNEGDAYSISMTGERISIRKEGGM